MTTHLTVTAHLGAPVIGVTEKPFMLDAPLAWAYAQTHEDLPPLTPTHAPDMPLPLAKESRAGTWYWRTSQAKYTIDGWTGLEIRRKPPTTAMAKLTNERKHHAGLGPYKARDTTVTAAIIKTLTWGIECTDRKLLETLLAHITHVGKHRNIGYGKVTKWEIRAASDAVWLDRPHPTHGVVEAYRAPYWHPTRKVTVN